MLKKFLNIGSSKHLKMIKLAISVDGNISSGKSTLVEKLSSSFPTLTVKTPDLEIIPEPLEKWLNLKGHNLLGMFYENPKKYNFIFQHYVQLTRLMDTVRKLHANDSKSELRIRLMERSLQNNRYCFVELARKQGTLHEAEYGILVEWYNWLERNLDLSLDVIIYLRTKPEVVFSRMKSRGRTEESDVPLDYLQALHDTYEQWLIKQNPDDVSRRQNVIVVNANQSKEQVFEEAKTLLLAHLRKTRPELCVPADNSPCTSYSSYVS